MMKTKRFFQAALVLIAMVSVVACTEKEKDKATKVDLTGLSETIHFEAANPSSVSFKIQSTKNWAITTKGGDWFSVSPTEGEADKAQTVTVTAVDNPGIDAREASMTISSAEFSQTVTIDQMGAAPALFIDGATENAVHFETAGGTASLTATGNIEWKAETADLDWCTVTPMEGPAGASTAIKLEAGSNKGDAREGTITFKYGESSIVIKVSQDELKRYLSADKNEIEIADWGGVETIKVSSNIDWTATCPDSWLKISPATGTGDNVDFTMEADEFNGERKTTVTFKGEGVADLTISVTQKHITLPDDPNLPKILATWNLSEDPADEERFLAHNPGWPKTPKAEDGQVQEYRKSGVIIAEDNINTGEWMITHTEPATADDYFRTNWSDGLMACGIWLNDGFKFSAKNITVDAGRSIAFYCGMKTSTPKVIGVWTVKISYDGGNTWVDADSITWTNSSGAAKTRVVSPCDVTAHFLVRKPIKNQDVYVYIFATKTPTGTVINVSSGSTTFEKQKEGGYQMRFMPPLHKYNERNYVGPTIVLEN